MTRKTIALIQGDPGGIGPELLHKLLSDEEVRDSANLVVIGAPDVFARAETQMGSTIPVRNVPFETDIHHEQGEILQADQDERRVKVTFYAPSEPQAAANAAVVA